MPFSCEGCPLLRWPLHNFNGNQCFMQPFRSGAISGGCQRASVCSCTSSLIVLLTGSVLYSNSGGMQHDKYKMMNIWRWAENEMHRLSLFPADSFAGCQLLHVAFLRFPFADSALFTTIFVVFNFLDLFLIGWLSPLLQERLLFVCTCSERRRIHRFSFVSGESGYIDIFSKLSSKRAGQCGFGGSRLAH